MALRRVGSSRVVVADRRKAEAPEFFLWEEFNMQLGMVGLGRMKPTWSAGS